MKKLLAICVLLLPIFAFSGCDVTFREDLAYGYTITINCEKSEIEELFDDGLEHTKEEIRTKLESTIDNMCKELNIDHEQIELKNFTINRKDYCTLLFIIKQNEDLDKAFSQGFAYGNADELLEMYLQNRYQSTDFEGNIDNLLNEGDWGSMHIVNSGNTELRNVYLNQKINTLVEKIDGSRKYKGMYINSSYITKYIISYTEILVFAPDTMLDLFDDTFYEADNRFESDSTASEKSDKVHISGNEIVINNPSNVLFIYKEQLGGRVGTIIFIIVCIIGILLGVFIFSPRNRYY